MIEATTTIPFRATTAKDALTEVVRIGAQRMLTAALEAEVETYIEGLKHVLDEKGHRLVVLLARLARNALASGAQAGGGIVTFDGASAPCFFIDTSVLNGVVEGVMIRGRIPNGGAILDQCSNFGVPALSPPNFLAFSMGGLYPGGGAPELPELFLLEGTYSSISVPLSGGFESGIPISIVAFGPSGIVALKSVVTTTGWVTHTLSGAGISGFLLLGNPTLLVVDDVQYQ